MRPRTPDNTAAVGIRDVLHYFLQKTWRTLLLVGAGTLFALTLASLIDINLVGILRNRVSTPLQVLLAEFVGFVSPGPRYIIYPVLVKLTELGVETAVIISLISGHVLIEPSTFAVEAGFFGYRFPLKRFLAAAIVTYVAGMVTALFFNQLL